MNRSSYKDDETKTLFAADSSSKTLIICSRLCFWWVWLFPAFINLYNKAVRKCKIIYSYFYVSQMYMMFKNYCLDLHNITNTEVSSKQGHMRQKCTYSSKYHSSTELELTICIFLMFCHHSRKTGLTAKVNCCLFIGLINGLMICVLSVVDHWCG